MDPTYQTNMNTDAQTPLEEQLSQLFGSYKAEWLKEQLFELFTEPTYIGLRR